MRAADELERIEENHAGRRPIHIKIRDNQNSFAVGDRLPQPGDSLRHVPQ